MQNNAGEEVGLKVAPGNTLSLVGGNINFESGQATANSGNIELGGLEDAGTVTLNDDGSLTFPENVARADITLSNAADIDVTGTGGGSITINAGNLTLKSGDLGRSQIRAGITADSTLVGAASGNIIINATENLIIDNSRISNVVGLDALGNGGNITITTDDLSLSNAGLINTSTVGQGNAGNIEITATDTVRINGDPNSEIPTGIFSIVTLFGVGNGGDITINTNSLSLSNIGLIDASTVGQGNAGNIEITATDNITLDIFSSIASVVDLNAAGDGGDITINTNSLSLNNEAQINSSTDTTMRGDGGDITINTNSLSLNNGAFIDASTFGVGNAGNINVNATESILISGSGLIPIFNPDTQEIEIINVRSGLYANGVMSNGNGGNINVVTSQLTIDDAGTIQAGNFDQFDSFSPGTGEPGNINIQANSLNLSNEARIVANTQAETGNSANINLEIADEIVLRNNSFISAEALNNANGGNLTINTNFIVAFPSNNNGNDITARAEQGMGGNINITAQALLGIEERTATPGNRTNDIDASSEFGLDGNVTFNVPDTNNFQETAELSSNVFSAESVVEDACAAGARASGLVLKGKRGIPPTPDSPLSAEVLLDNGKPIKPNFSQLNQQQAINNNTFQIQPIKTSQGDIYPARGVIVREDGTAILTPYPTNNIATRTPEDAVNCHQL